MNVAIYLRKSRVDLDASESTLSSHKKILMDFAKENNFQIVRIYEEVVSGETITGRPQMIQLLEDVDSGLYDAVLVMDMDRLGRGNMQEQGLILDTFQRSKTKIITPLKTYDLQDEIDQEYSEFLAFLSRKEFKMINRRLIRGKHQKIKEGNFIAPDAPYGYQIEKDNRSRYLVPHPNESKIVELIFNLYVKERMGARRIITYLINMGIPTRNGAYWQEQTIHRILANEVYIGRIQYKKVQKSKSKQTNQKRVVKKRDRSEWIDTLGKHEPLVSEEIFYKAQEIKKENMIVPLNRKHSLANPLSGLVKCAYCNLMMGGHRSGKEYHRLRCNRSCGNRSATLSAVEQRILEEVKKWIKEYEFTLKDNIDQPKINLAIVDHMNAEIQSLDNQLEKQMDLLERGLYDEEMFLKRSISIKKRKQDLQEQLAHILKKKQEEIEKSNLKQTLVPHLKSALDLYELADTAKQKNVILKSIIKEVIYERKGDDPFKLDIRPRL